MPSRNYPQPELYLLRSQAALHPPVIPPLAPEHEPRRVHAVDDEVQVRVRAVLVRDDDGLVLLQAHVPEGAIGHAPHHRLVHRIVDVEADGEEVDRRAGAAHRAVRRRAHEAGGELQVASREVVGLRPGNAVLPAPGPPDLRVQHRTFEAAAQRVDRSNHRVTAIAAVWMLASAAPNSSSAGSASATCAWCVSSLRTRPRLSHREDERLRAAVPRGGGLGGVLGDADGAFERRRDGGGAIVLREVEELVEVVEHPLELAHEDVHAPAAGVRRQPGGKRGLAHVAQRRDAADARRLLDVTPLVRGPDGRLPDGPSRGNADAADGGSNSVERAANGTQRGDLDGDECRAQLLVRRKRLSGARLVRKPVEDAARLPHRDDQRLRAAAPPGGGPGRLVGDTDGTFERGRDAGIAGCLREAEELVEGVEHPRELVEQRASAAAAGARRKLGRERGLAHVAQRADAAGDRGLFDAAPLLGGPDGRLPDGTAGRHAAVVVRCPSSAARSQPAGRRPRAQRANLGASPRCWLRKFRALQSRSEGRYRDLRRTVLRHNDG